jgi:hypothetical protein
MQVALGATLKKKETYPVDLKINTGLQSCAYSITLNAIYDLKGISIDDIKVTGAQTTFTDKAQSLRLNPLYEGAEILRFTSEVAYLEIVGWNAAENFCLLTIYTSINKSKFQKFKIQKEECRTMRADPMDTDTRFILSLQRRDFIFNASIFDENEEIQENWNSFSSYYMVSRLTPYQMVLQSTKSDSAVYFKSFMTAAKPGRYTTEFTIYAFGSQKIDQLKPTSELKRSSGNSIASKFVNSGDQIYFLKGYFDFQLMGQETEILAVIVGYKREGKSYFTFFKEQTIDATNYGEITEQKT